MQRSRLKNIIAKSKEQLQDPFDYFKKSLPKEIDDNYRLEAAWKDYGRPKDYKAAIWEGMILPIDENNYKFPSIGYNEEKDEYEYLNKGKYNEIVAKDIRVWDNDVIPFVKELKQGGFIRVYDEEKDCWTYSKNKSQDVESFKSGGKKKIRIKTIWDDYIEVDSISNDQRAGRVPIGKRNGQDLNKVESESNNILSKIDIISKEIRKIIEMRESEVDNYKVESDKIEENITALTNELEVLKIENFRQQTKYDDINKKNKKIYDNTYKKYEEQRKLLMLEIDQLKSRKKKYVSKLRIVEKLKNSNKDENKVDETNKSINNENLLNQKEHNIVENNTNLNEENKSPSASIEKPKLKKKKNSSSFIRKFEKSRK